jgi:hypothetical protein
MNDPTAFRAQFRQPGTDRWATFAEQPTESAAWDEALSSRELAGHDLRVVRVDRPAAYEPKGPTPCR